MTEAIRLPYTVKQVAEMVGCSTDTIRKEIRAGHLKARHRRGRTKIWYVTKEDLSEWAENYLEEA